LLLLYYDEKLLSFMTVKKQKDNFLYYHNDTVSD
jgi:hypothetical protein